MCPGRTTIGPDLEYLVIAHSGGGVLLLSREQTQEPEERSTLCNCCPEMEGHLCPWEAVKDDGDS